ncbi:hypothetical protein JHC09_16295 [Devosia sp. MC532]|uniref:hypothetical protein n=1 Tax=Devosia sp. MC532 TaxID=2799788 RepID=UPI0018F602F7|nr:hypothetical protein [Devosia sp. MC532]MBJ7579436.1 hypothetical protein [Devosia sp. MC532]
MSKTIDGNSLVSFGENTTVSMQTVQHIYSKITGKTEKLSHIFETPHLARFADLEQINSTIEQACEQYTIVSKDCFVDVFHLSGAKQTFSSFNRFKLFEAGSNDPTENIRLT